MTTEMAETLEDGIHALMTIEDGAFSRWPVVRYGARRTIPIEAQRLVFARDNYRCKICGCDHDFEPLEIDHVVPWSAGGTDTTENLRVLCRLCNGRRSNRKEVYLPRQVPCVQRCVPCWVAERPDYPIWDDRISAWCGTCGLTSWVDDVGYLW